MSTLIVTSDIGIECAFSALGRFLLPDVVWANLPVKTLRTPNHLENVMSCKTTLLILFGDYWSPEEVASHGAKHFNFASGTPFTDLINYVVSLPNSNVALIQFAVGRHKTLITMLDDRVCGRKTFETQPLITGMFNILTDLPTETRYYKLFMGEIELSEVIKLGEAVVESQMQVVKERAIKNSRVGTFKDGTTYAITDSPEFINMTHDELKKVYQTVDVTITATLKFAPDADDTVAHSLRSWNSAVDVKTIIGSYGGGSATAAGGRRAVNVQIDY